MNFTSFCYQLGQGLRNIFKQKLMSLASIGVLISCLVLIGASVVATQNIEALVDSVQDQNKIVAFADFSVDSEELEEERQQLEEKINQLGNIKELEFVSPQQALEEQKAEFGEDAVLLEGFEGENNPYPGKFIITVAEQEKLEETVKQLQTVEGIEKVNSAVEVSNLLVNVRDLVYLCGTITFLLLVVVSMVIIFNTIRLAVYSRRREIHIMKMVGATNGFIRTPFLVEGGLLGLIGAIVSLLLLWGGYEFLLSQFDLGQLFGMTTYQGMIPFAELFPKLFLIFLPVGILTGIIGSLTAVRKHLVD